MAPEKLGESNLIGIYSVLTEKTTQQVEEEFAGKGYGAFKPAVAEAVVETLNPFRIDIRRIYRIKRSWRRS